MLFNSWEFAVFFVGVFLMYRRLGLRQQNVLAAAMQGERADVVGDDGRTKWRPEERETGVDAFDLAPYQARLRARIDADLESRLQGVVEAVRDAGRSEQPRNPASASPVLLDVLTGEAARLEERDFLDERHLGTRGAEKFSRFLAAWVTARYGLQ